jgi:hypothetical protein
MITKDQWEWFGYPGHLIVAPWCQFRLCTKVGDYLISTVGDWRPPLVGEQTAPRKTIGAGDDSFFETYVFEAGERCSHKDCGCNMPSLKDACEIDGERSGTAGAATEAHLRYCTKYSALQNQGDAPSDAPPL